MSLVCRSPRGQLAHLPATVLLSLLAFVLLGGLVACSASASAPRAASDTIPYDAAHAGNFSVAWRTQVGLAGNERIQHVWHVGDTLYVSTTAGILHAIDPSDGTSRWTFQADAGTGTLLRPAEMPNPDELLVLAKGHAWILGKHTGRAIASVNLRFALASNPLIIGDTICVGGARNYFYGLFLDLLNGVSWRTGSMGDSFANDPVPLDAKHIVITSSGGIIWVVNAEDGTFVWTGGNRQIRGEIHAPVGLADDRMYVASTNGRAYAYEAATGTYQWDTLLSGTLDQQPVGIKGGVVVVGRGAGAFALKATDGSKLWSTPGIAKIIARSHDLLYAVNDQGGLTVINTADGKVARTTPITGGADYIGTDNSPVLFIATRDGWVVRVHDDAR